MEAKIVRLNGESVDVTSYVELLEFYGYDGFIELMEDVAFAYAAHYLENAEELCTRGTAERLHLLRQLIMAVREIKPVAG